MNISQLKKISKIGVPLLLISLVLFIYISAKHTFLQDNYELYSTIRLFLYIGLALGMSLSAINIKLKDQNPENTDIDTVKTTSRKIFDRLILIIIIIICLSILYFMAIMFLAGISTH